MVLSGDGSQNHTGVDKSPQRTPPLWEDRAVTQAEVRELLLSQAYANNTGDVVAFIDESYLAPSFGFPGATTFYLAAAYVIPIEDLDTIRSDLPGVVDSTFWHSTEAHQSEVGRERIAHLISYIAEGDETIIVAAKNPIDASDGDGEIARQQCLTELLSVLSSGLVCDPVSLAILEERKFGSQKAADQKTITLARAGGHIDRHMRVLPTSPSAERLLWLPDVVAFALYRQWAGAQGDYVGPISDRVRLIEVK